MMRNRLLLAAAVTLAAAAAVPASAQETGCRLRIDANPSSWIVRGYDPFGDEPPSGTFSLLFTNEGEEECVFFPVFALDQEPFGLKALAGRPVAYALVDLHGGYDATPLGGRTLRRPRRSVVVAPRGQEVVQYRLVVDSDSIARAGLHDQRVEVEAENEDGQAIAGQQLVLGVDVLPSAVLGVAGAYRVNNGQAVVDLGELREGVPEVPLQLRVQSTGRYRLTLDSRNRGRLRLSGSDWYIPYGLALGGQSVDLSGGDAEYLSQPAAGLRRESLPVQFRIGDVSDRRAGTYVDVISISVEPL